MNGRYALRRLLQVVPTVLIIVTVTFVLLHMAPGDPVLALAGEYGDAAYYERVRTRFGLDQPLPQRFATYLANLARGDLGTSFVHGRAALGVVTERLPATLLLATSSLAISTTLGIALGVLAAGRASRASDLLVRAGALLAYATPSFWLAQLAALALGFGTGWFPVQGMTDARTSPDGLAALLDIAHHLVLPAMVLAAAELALTTRLVRAGLVETLGETYIRTARCKGMSDRTVVHHALRNALLPLATVLGSRIGMFFTGAVLVEVVFAWPGIGRLLLSSAQARDYPVLLTIFLVVAFGVVLVNLLTDLLYSRVDPRIRYE